MSGVAKLVAAKLHGSGTSLSEGLRLRVKDLGLLPGQILVRDGKQGKDRRTMPPKVLRELLAEQMEKARLLRWLELPHALERKYPNAASKWGWQFLSRSQNRSVDPRSGRIGRHHIDESTVQRAMRREQPSRRMAGSGLRGSTAVPRLPIDACNYTEPRFDPAPTPASATRSSGGGSEE